jgi:hypothetical protein
MLPEIGRILGEANTIIFWNVYSDGLWKQNLKKREMMDIPWKVCVEVPLSLLTNSCACKFSSMIRSQITREVNIMLFILCVSILRNEMKRGTLKQLQNSKIVKRGNMDTTNTLYWLGIGSQWNVAELSYFYDPTPRLSVKWCVHARINDVVYGDLSWIRVIAQMFELNMKARSHKMLVLHSLAKAKYIIGKIKLN